jgi:hypothetical protein
VRTCSASRLSWRAVGPSLSFAVALTISAKNAMRNWSRLCCILGFPVLSARRERFAFLADLLAGEIRK